MLLRNLDEGVGIALEALRSNKLRSALTSLAAVSSATAGMAVAARGQGSRTRSQCDDTAGPTAFYVMRSQTPLNPDRLPYEVRIRPVLETTDAEAIARVPDVAYAGLWVQLFQRVEYQGERTQTVTVFGADNGFMDIQGGTLLRGRLFSRAELAGDPVVVLENGVAERLFGQVEPLGRFVRIGAKSVRVIGIWQKPGNVFEPPGQETAGVMPFEFVHQNYRYDNTNGLFIAAKPRIGVTVDQAKDLVTAALRRVRNLRPGMPDTFDLITQDQILAVVSNFTSYFFVAMVALSSVALLVGGIGVMAIMMVSVTDRTREIGLRKALGATRREILWQFLVEAATLTSIGGAVGIVMGLGAGELLKLALNLQSDVPLWSAALAAGVSITIGLIFGLYPANRAARMDPVEALRRE
jgi:putative ABC transport system permease protein